MSHHEYDYAIVGSGLTGLALATALSRETKNIILLEGQDHIGGYNREINFPTGAINNGMRFIPDTPAAEKSINFLENLLGLKLIQEKVESAPITYEDGQLKPFLSFGQTTPDFFEEIVYFINPKYLKLHLEPYKWIQLLQEKYQGEAQTKAFVTRFQIEGNQVKSVLINGSKSIHAKNFIFCGSVKQLQTLLPTDFLASRARQKLSKSTYWTALCLDLCHNHVVNETDAIHVLNGTTQDEIGPCVGRFLPPENILSQNMQSSSEVAAASGAGPRQSSQWMTFVDDQESEESEIIATALKKIKRQIKRAYPLALDGLITERILVASQIGGHGELKVKSQGTLPEVDNLWIGSPTMNAQKNLVGSLMQVQFILAALGFDAGIETGVEVSTTAGVEACAEANVEVNTDSCSTHDPAINSEVNVNDHLDLAQEASEDPEESDRT